MRLAPTVIFGLLILAGPTVFAADTATTKAELKASFSSRADQLTAAKTAGSIGETTNGLVAAVATSPDAGIIALVTAENADRLTLYQVLAGETTATPAQIGERNAMRNYQNAVAGTWLRTRDGQWKKK